MTTRYARMIARTVERMVTASENLMKSEEPKLPDLKEMEREFDAIWTAPDPEAAEAEFEAKYPGGADRIMKVRLQRIRRP